MATKRKRDLDSSSTSSLDKNHNGLDEASETEIEDDSQVKTGVEDEDSQVTVPTTKKAKVSLMSSHHGQEKFSLKMKKKSKIQKQDKKVTKMRKFKFRRSKSVLNPEKMPETSEQESLRNTLVLDQVMKRLNVTDLKNCRLVNKYWLAVASRELRKYPATVVRLKYRPKFGKDFYWDPKVERGVAFEPPSPEEWSLKAFNKLMANCQNLPCSNFSFSDGKLKDPQAQLFFSRIGPEIKSLTLSDGNSNSKSKTTFQQLLTIKAPNVTRLTIQSGFSHHWKEIDDLFLPSLKYFKVGQGTKPNMTTEKILKSAVNLEEFDGFTRNHIQVLKKSNKIHLVKKMKVDLASWTWPTASLIELVEARPQLVDLEFVVSETWSHTSTVQKQDRVELMMMILESSKYSLKKLKLRRLLFKDNTVFPRLENLEALFLEDPSAPTRRQRWHAQNHVDDDNKSRFFPVGINVWSTFPKLQTLICGSINDWEKRFPRADDIASRFWSVKTIEIRNAEAKFWLYRLEGLCPNYTKLKLHGISDLESFLPKVFESCDELKHLEILLDSCGRCYPNFDPIFTGFSKVHCQLLLAKLSSGGRVSRYERMRVDPWIGYLRHLKSLKIYFTNFRRSWLDDPSSAPEHIIISAISHLYAFDLMKRNKLEVTIGYDHHSLNGPMMTEILDSIKPFVNIVNHRPKNDKE